MVGKNNNLKRENFDVSPEQQAELEALQALIGAPSKKEAMLLAVRATLHIAAEIRKGNQIFIGDPAKQDLRRFLMIGIEKPDLSKWTYLTARPHPWKRQLFVKGRKLPAAAVWTSMVANRLTEEEAANNWDLPIEAIREIIEYCEGNKRLLELEAQEELQRLEEKGIGIALKVARG